jgi:outer membrane protein OmpA-like peptidoglycan-associated protein
MINSAKQALLPSMIKLNSKTTMLWCSLMCWTAFGVLACEPLNVGLLSADLQTQKSQLQDANFDCEHLTNFIQLAKVYQQLNEPENANQVMLEALNNLVVTDGDKINWLTVKTELALANDNTCEASKNINELSSFEQAKHTQQNLRKKLFESTQNQTLDSATIACALSASRTVTARGMKVRPKLDLAIHFNFDSDVLTEQGQTQSRNIAIAMATASMKEKKLKLIGHTDKVGEVAYNLNLSQRRAQAVQSYLLQLDANLQSRISSLGMGESQLLSEGDSDQDHQLNRRVELELLEQ